MILVITPRTKLYLFRFVLLFSVPYIHRRIETPHNDYTFQCFNRCVSFEYKIRIFSSSISTSITMTPGIFMQFSPFSSGKVPLDRRGHFSLKQSRGDRKGGRTDLHRILMGTRTPLQGVLEPGLGKKTCRWSICVPFQNPNATFRWLKRFWERWHNIIIEESAWCFCH